MYIPGYCLFAADTVYRRVTQRGKEWKQVYLKKSLGTLE